MVHLDTSFLIRALVAGSPQDRRLREWIKAGTPLGISNIVWTEFLCGPVEAPQIELAMRIVGERIPYTEDHAVLAARLFNSTGRRRGSLADCMIAVTAVLADAELATANLADFRPFKALGLTLVD